MSFGGAQVSGRTRAVEHAPTSRSCAEEPIHRPGAIQPFGALIVIDRDGRVVAVSQNLADHLGVDPDDALGALIEQVLGEQVRELVLSAADIEPGGVRRVATSGLAGSGQIDVHVAASGDHRLVGIEAASSTPLAVEFDNGLHLMNRMAAAPDVVSIAQVLIDSVAQLTGFDRVLAYRFDTDWHGEVIAECRRPDLDSWAGLHYPAADIPDQARALYLHHPLQLLADVEAEPSRLIAEAGRDVADLDLGGTVLRAMSPVHRHYLRNLGATASMSISLVVEGRLWGMVTCQHYDGPRPVSSDVRAACSYLAQLAAILVYGREINARATRSAEVRDALMAMCMRLSASTGPVVEALLDDADLLELAGADGALVFVDGVTHRVGDLPSSEVCDEAIRRLLSREQFTRFTDDLPGLLGRPPGEGVAGGMLVSSDLRDRGLVLYRREEVQVIPWAGEPTHASTPRTDFEPWHQVVRGRCRAWEPWEVEAVELLRQHAASLMHSRDRQQIEMIRALRRSIVSLDELGQVVGDDVAISTRYLPASADAMGGDWWDVFTLDDGRLAVVIGDVAGHGVEAATSMTQVRAALRAYLYEGHGPAVALDRLDRLVEGLIGDRVATAAVALIEKSTRRVEFASAGHPSPMVVGSSDASDVETPQRPLLGVGISGCTTVEFVLDPGATLLFYTDGLIERRECDLEVGREHLRRAVVGASGALEDWLDEVVWSQGIEEQSAADDTTMLAIRIA